MLVVDESSLASSEQMRNLMRIATALRLPRVVLVGDEKQLGAVEAGKPFGQLRAAGMATTVMDDIVRQRDAELKAAVKASLTGDVKTAFAKLGGNIRQVEYGDLGIETARRWLNLPPGERERTGTIAPTRALRDEINATIREGLVAEGAISGPARRGEKLVPRDLTRAQMASASNYNVGDTVIFNRPYKRLGVGKGDERTVTGIDRRWGTVHLEEIARSQRRTRGNRAGIRQAGSRNRARAGPRRRTRTRRRPREVRRTKAEDARPRPRDVASPSPLPANTRPATTPTTAATQAPHGLRSPRNQSRDRQPPPRGDGGAHPCPGAARRRPAHLEKARNSAGATLEIPYLPNARRFALGGGINTENPVSNQSCNTAQCAVAPNGTRVFPRGFRRVSAVIWRQGVPEGA